MRPLHLRLPEGTADRLAAIAWSELRSPRDQAVFMLSAAVDAYVLPERTTPVVVHRDGRGTLSRDIDGSPHGQVVRQAPE